jgi:hypothetical protein
MGALRARLALGACGALPEWFEVGPAPKRVPARNGPDVVPGPAPAGGDAVSIVAAAELLTVWIEELDHAAEPAATLAQ